MTLRCTLEIVPYGDESSKYLLREFDISNVGVVERQGFGHDLCAYWVDVYEPTLADGRVLERAFPLPETHDRRDGAELLVAKVLETYESGWTPNEEN